MYFSTSDGREVTTKRQLDGSVQPVKADKSYSYVPRLLMVIICMRLQDNYEGFE
jgi:hypothetical protein